MINLPTTINICGKIYTCIRDRSITGAEFEFNSRTIIIGDCADHAVLDYLVHEISEVIHIILGTRIEHAGNNGYVFLMNHNNFQTHNEILVETLLSNNIITFNCITDEA